jgi:hypothetical protein
MICPLCGSAMERHDRPDEAVVSELVMKNGGALVRVSRPAVWLGCTGCEHCEEVNRD